MNNKNKKNKISKKIVLSTIVLSSFTGIAFSSLSINNETKSNVNLNSNNIVKSNKSTRATPTKIVLKPGINANNYYPFQIHSPVGQFGEYGNIFDFFMFEGDLNETTATSITVTSLSYQNNSNNSGTLNGRLDFSIEMSPYIDNDGNLQNLKRTFPFNGAGFKSVEGGTAASPSSKRPIADTDYASDIKTNEEALEYIQVINPIVNVLFPDGRPQTDVDTVLSVESYRADNNKGSLYIKYKILNIIDRDGNYIPNETIFPFDIEIDGFTSVKGPTKFKIIEENAKFVQPSALEANPDRNYWSRYFSIENPLQNPNGSVNTSTKVESVTLSNPNDDEGTIQVTMSVTGGYYKTDLTPVRPDANTDPFNITFTIGGFKTTFVPVDNTLIIVGSAAGGLVLIVIIALILFFIIKNQKKKNEAMRKKKSMEDRLSMASTGPKIGSGASISPTRSMNSLGAKPGAPGAAPGKYVPPTISVPKSNAPQAKRPSGPLPTKK